MSHIRRTTFRLLIDDDMVEEVFSNIVVRVGKSLGLRGIARQLEYRGDMYYVMVEGYDYQTREYVQFFKTGYDAIGEISRVRNYSLPTIGDMKLPRGFWCVQAPVTQVPETDSDKELDDHDKLVRYLKKHKKM